MLKNTEHKRIKNTDNTRRN